MSIREAITSAVLTGIALAVFAAVEVLPAWMGAMPR
jgi:hypothetical protein